MKILINALAAAVLLSACGCGDDPAAPADERGAEPAAGVEVAAAAQEEGGIKTETLRRASVPETFQAMGRVLQDAQKPYHITAGGAGRVESLPAELGAAVNPGDVLAVIKNRSGAESKVSAPRKGIVTAVHAAAGDQVNEMSFLFTLTDVDPLWGVLDIPERSLELVRPGQKVGIKTAAYSGRTFKGTVASVSPEIDQVSRTVKARVSIENPAGLLKFGMFIDATVRTGAYFQGVAVRSDAVQNGPGGPFVFVRNGETGFTPRPVETGREKDGLVELKKGVAAGEMVVVEGAYLLKSEMMKGQLGED